MDPRRRLVELEAELERVRREIADVRASLDIDTQPRAASRRQALKLAAGGVGALAAATVAGTQRAAAADDPLVGGTVNTTTKSTELRYTGTTSPAHHIVWVQDGGRTGFPESAFPRSAALSGWCTGNWVEDGVQGVTEGVGFGGNFEGRGVFPTLGTASGIRVKGERATMALVPGKNPSINAFFDREPGEVLIDNNGDLWMCVRAGNPGDWRKIAGPATSGQLHLLASPARCYDSREGQAPTSVVKGKLPANTDRTVSTLVTSDGSASLVPDSALGVMINLTVVDPEGAGFLAVNAAGAARPDTSVLNFAAGQTIANGASVACGPNASITVFCGGGAGNVHFVVDVMGYYR
jgi:hypothetical protein